MSTNNAPGFVSGLKAFFDNPLYSDLTLLCGGEQFKVHRMLLHEQSPVFRKMLSGDFMESVTNQKVITVYDDPPVFRSFLKYLYSGQYDDSGRGNMPQPEFAISVYAIADKYNFEPLRKAAARKLDETCDAQNNANDFIGAIYAIDANTAPDDFSLWKVVLPKIKANITTLSQSPDFLKMATVDIPDLAAVLFRGLDGNEIVFRSKTLIIPPVINNAAGQGTGKVKDESSSDDEEMDTGHAALHARRAPRPGPYRGQGRRLGDA